jgi:hypothetical protein
MDVVALEWAKAKRFEREWMVDPVHSCGAASYQFGRQVEDDRRREVGGWFVYVLS